MQTRSTLLRSRLTGALAASARWFRSQPLSARIVGAAAAANFCVAALIACDSIPDPAFRPGASAGDLVPYTEPDIRVRIRTGIDKAEITGPREVIVRRGPLSRDLTLTTPVRVSVGGDGVLLTPASGEPVSTPAGTAVTIETPTQSVPLAIDGQQYPGRLVFRDRTDLGVGRFDAIADMGMEAYLPGVLAKELYASWPLATYQAQAVAARSYAIHERTRARQSRKPFDVESSTLDQAFIGTTTHERARMGAFSTRGVVLLDGGRILRAYYSSTHGGRNASAAGIWPSDGELSFNQAAPLQGTGAIRHACEGAPLHRWTRTRSAADVTKRLQTWARGKGDPMRGMSRVMAIAYGNLNAAGRPNAYIITDADGRTYRILADDLRVAMNISTPGLPDVTRDTMVPSNDFEATVVGSNVSIRGRGFGHGVGMCQYSAKAMAEQGDEWRKIVTNFYPGATVKRIY